MALVIADRVRETTTSTGTGTITLAGPYTGFQAFSVIGNGNTTYYALIDAATGSWEVGIGTYTATGNTLSRDTVLSSSNGGAAVNFSAGTKDVIITQPASRAVYLDTASNVTIPGITLSAGTANGVAYLNGSKVLTTGSALTFDGTNLGVGTTTPGTYGKFVVNGNAALLAAGAPYFYNAANDAWSYIKNAASAGSADLTFNLFGSEQMRLTSTGLGIGTSSPVGKLDARGQSMFAVSGTPTFFLGSTDAVTAFSANGSEVAIRTWQAGVASAMIGHKASDQNLYITNTYSGNALGAGGLVLDSSNNLGLGVTPSAWNSAFRALEIYGKGSGIYASSAAQTFVTANAYYDSVGLKYGANAPATYYSQSYGTHSWYTAPSGTAGDPIGFTQAMTLDASGNLGVGTSSPISKLDAVVNVSGGSDILTIQNQNTGANTTKYAGLKFKGNDTVGTSKDSAFIRAFPSDQDFVGSYLSFWTRNADSLGERLRIEATGNLVVGIGKWFGINSTAGYYADDASVGGAIYTSGGFRVFTGGANERMRIDSSGNLLVGTTSQYASSLLSVAGPIAGRSTGVDGTFAPVFNAVYSGNSAQFGTIAHSMSSIATASGFRFLGGGAGGGGTTQEKLLDLTRGQTIFYTNDSEQMRLTSTGLGIGTSSPGAKLDVQPATYTFGTAQAEVIRIRGNASGGTTTSPTSAGALVWGNGTNTQAVINSIIDNPSASSRSALAFSTNIAGTLTEAMRLDSSGNLGLGVTPSAWGASAKAFQIGAYSAVYQNASGYPEVAFNTYQNTSNAYTYQVSSNPATRFSQTNGAFQWYTAPSGTAGNAITFTQAMTLDASGNLQVGATTGSGINERLSVVGNGIVVASSYSSRALIGQFGSSDFVVGTFDSFPMVFRTGNTERARIDSSGNLLVGITSGIYKFMVGDGTRNMTINPNSSLDAIFFGTTTSKPLVFGTGDLERARIDSSGNLLIGTTSAFNACKVGIKASAASFNILSIGNTSATNGTFIGFLNSSDSTAGFIAQTGTTTVAYNTSSDYRLKDNIQPMTGALAKVAALKPCTYKWKADGSEGEGFIAHELAEVVPQCVTGEKDAVDAEGNPVYQGIDTSFLVATLTAAIQEQQAIINQLKARLDAANL